MPLPIPSELTEQIDEFIHPRFPVKHQWNKWLVADGVKLYVRRSNRFLLGREKAITCFDLASIEIDRHLRSQGLFKSILKYMMDVCPWDAVLVENVLNPSLRNHMEERLMMNRTNWFWYGKAGCDFLWLKNP